MSKLNQSDFEKIKLWMYRNARPLEMASWKYFFENGSAKEVIRRVADFQNEDGGFGNAIEPDLCNPNSTPYATHKAIAELEELGDDSEKDAIYQKIIKYLENTLDKTIMKWPSTIPSNNEFPRAPWWTHTEENPYDWGYLPTAYLAGFLVKYADENTDIYKIAKDIALGAVDTYINGTLPDGRPYSSEDRESEIEMFCYLSECLEAEGLDTKENISKLRNIMIENVNKFMEKDPTKWNQYCRKPSVYIDSPTSLFYKGNEEAISKELDYLMDGRDENGIWDTNWTWEAEWIPNWPWEKYRDTFSVSRNWWKGILVIRYLRLLKVFGR